MKPSNTPQTESNSHTPNTIAAVAMFLAIIAVIICMIFWPNETTAVAIAIFALAGITMGFLFGKGGGAASGCLGGGIIAGFLCFTIYLFLSLLGWEPPEDIARKAEAASARAEYIALCEQLDKQPAIDDARRELIWKIWDREPTRAAEIIAAAIAQPPKIPTTRDLLAVIEPYPENLETPAEKNRWNERTEVERNKRETVEKQKNEEDRRRKDIARKRWDIISKIKQKAPDHLKRFSETELYYNSPNPTYEELLNLLTEIEEQEATRATNPDNHAPPPPPVPAMESP